VMVF